MPSWSVHLAIAKKLNEKLKLNKDVFYYGNLIPDVDKNSPINRYNAHYYGNIQFPNCPKENMIDIKRFINDYKDHIENPLILGYYCHLLTDNFYNNIVYTKCWIQDQDNNIIGIKFKNNKIKSIDKDDKKWQKQKYKHKDFELYGKYLYNDQKVEVPKNSQEVEKNIELLKNNLLNKNLVETRIKYLNKDFNKFNKLTLKEKVIRNNYKLFTKEELDNTFYNCINYILKEINRLCETKMNK